VQLKAKEEEQKMTQTVLNEVNDYLKEYGEKHNYTFILGATGVGNIVYAKKSRDITEEILNGLNKLYKKSD
jgi:outer membrane protein